MKLQEDFPDKGKRTQTTWGILLGTAAAVGGLFGIYAFAAYQENQIVAEACSTLFHLPMLSLLPLFLSPLFGTFVGSKIKEKKQIYYFSISVFALSLSVLFIPIPMISGEWSIFKILAVTLFPAVLSVLTFRIGTLWGQHRAYYADTYVVHALRQMRSVWIYFLLVFSLALESILIPRVGYPKDPNDQEFLFFFIWYAFLFVNPMVCAILGWNLKRRNRISFERGLAFSLLVFFLFAGVEAFVLLALSGSYRPFLLGLWCPLQKFLYWLLPGAVTGVAFAIGLVHRRIRA